MRISESTGRRVLRAPQRRVFGSLLAMSLAAACSSELTRSDYGDDAPPATDDAVTPDPDAAPDASIAPAPAAREEDPPLRELMPSTGAGDVAGLTDCDRAAVRDAVAQIPRIMRVCFVSVRPPGATWTVTAADRAAALERLNASYAPAQLRFTEAGSTDLVDAASNVPAVMFTPHLNALFTAHERPDCLNVFVVNNLADGQWAGVGYFTALVHPSIAVIRTSLATSTLPHEVGHFLDLLHPHETANGVEAPDDASMQCTVKGASRPCCEVRGDLLCSTAADSLTACANNGACGATCSGDFAPDRRNVMSYGLDGCRDRFTAEQQRKALCTAVRYRAAALVGSCPPCGPRAPVCAAPATLQTFSNGRCDEASGECRYDTTDTTCVHGCADGRCLDCMPSCNGRVCGDNGCGGSCGSCMGDERCVAGACVYTCPADRGCMRPGRTCATGTAVLVCATSPRSSACFDSVLEPCRSGEACVDGRCVCAPGFVVVGGSCMRRVDEACNGVDDDFDGLVDEGLARCGLSIQCAPFAFNTVAPATNVRVALPDGARFIPWVETNYHNTQGEHDGGWNFDHAIVGSEMVFTYRGDGGRREEEVAGRVCVIGLGTTATAGVATDYRVNNGQMLTPTATPDANPFERRRVTLRTVRTYMTGSDDDFEFTGTPVANGITLQAFGGNGGSWLEADVVSLSLPEGTFAEQRRFRVSPAAGATVIFTRLPGLVAVPLTSYESYRTATDDFLGHELRCVTEPTRVVCTARTIDGNASSHVEGTVTLLQYAP